MRKYLFNGAVIGSVIGGWSVVQRTRSGPHDWKLLLTWITWGLTLAIAVGTVKEESDEKAIGR